MKSAKEMEKEDEGQQMKLSDMIREYVDMRLIQALEFNHPRNVYQAAENRILELEKLIDEREAVLMHGGR